MQDSSHFWSYVVATFLILVAFFTAYDVSNAQIISEQTDGSIESSGFVDDNGVESVFQIIPATTATTTVRTLLIKMSNTGAAVMRGYIGTSFSYLAGYPNASIAVISGCTSNPFSVYTVGEAQIIPLQFDNCVLSATTSPYVIEIRPDSSGGTIPDGEDFWKYFGSTAVLEGFECTNNDDNGTPSCRDSGGTQGIGSIMYRLSGDRFEGYPGIGFATSSSLFSGFDATSTLGFLDEQCSQISNIFAEGICISFSFLFLPSGEQLSQFTDLQGVLETKFPFSYIFSATDAWSDLSASTTSNLPEWGIGFQDTGIGSTSPLGLSNIAPNWTFFSTSTLETYAPDWFFPLMKTIIGFVFLYGTVSYIFRRSLTLLS